MGLNVQQDQQGAVRILTLQGRLDTDTAGDLELVIQDVLGAGERHFLLDLRGVSYISSAGLRVLLMLAKELEIGEGSLRLASMSTSVMQVFEAAGCISRFTIFSDRDTALRDHPQAGPDKLLAEKVVLLLGVGNTPAVNAMENNNLQLALIMAQLLGIEMPQTSSDKRRMAPTTVTQPQAIVQLQVSSRWIDKLRRLIRSKT